MFTPVINEVIRMHSAKPLTFDPLMWNGENVLLCPVCGEEYLHQGKIEVFERSEDDVFGTHTMVNGPCTNVCHDSLEGNPSARRQGLIIHFLCEGCGHIYVMEIYQHKGLTFMGWQV